ncbi:MAG: 2-phospho-L-lactate guanylyltransferase [archaeon]|nr:2-phospho-L-lactate guanylyltransferase [archaeon]MCP8314493.1 2-phospho-L-lactate guanylyltransferase [archaeon]
MSFVAIPVKGLKDAKRRLEVILRPEERRLLCIAMLRDVLKAVSISKYVGRVIIISCDKTILKLARKMRAIAFDEGESRGLNSAVERIARFCEDEGAKSILVLPIDIPLIESDDIDNIIQKSHPRSIVISPSMDEKGTNALLMNPPTVIKPRFGVNSFKTHINETIANRIQYEICKLPRVALDIDAPKDLVTFSKLGKGTETYDYMMKIDLVNRANEYLKGTHKPLVIR